MAAGETCRAALERDGFVVLEDFASAETCERLCARAAALTDGLEPNDAPTVFSTTDPDQDAYFLSSGDKIRYFFEEDAFDADGRLRVPVSRAINKIGHALHDLDPVFGPFSRDPRLASLVATLGVTEPLLLQSMIVFKQPGIGGVVVWHQDACFLRTEPQSVIGLWFALEDATRRNGCLQVLPGGHRDGVKAVFRRKPGGGTETETLDPTPWPDAGFVPLEVARGTLIVLHGSLPHGSAANRSARSRLAYTLHVIDGTARYPSDNWLQRSADMPLRGFSD